MKTIHCAALAAAAIAAIGCSTNPPLMFGDTTTFGLRLGSDTATGGGSVTLGYKAQSIAVVPVSGLDNDGIPKLLKGHGGGNGDAMSVFASFESAASSAGGSGNDSVVSLGQVFSTGLASQALTQGYLCRANADSDCSKTAATTALEAAANANRAAVSADAAAATARGTIARQTVVQGPAEKVTAAATEQPYQAPLLYLRTDVFGMDIGGSLAEQGLAFNLGLSSRNLALIPVYATASDGKLSKIAGDREGRSDSDALSVLGQFKSESHTVGLNFGLGRYFATGVAARNLGQSIATVIAGTPIRVAEPPAGAASTVAVNR